MIDNLFYFMVINVKGYEVLIDDEDFEKVNQHKWHIWKGKKTEKLYVIHVGHYRKNGIRISKTIRLHGCIMDTPIGMDTDHINGNTLDNRKCNLRICTRAENIRNSKVHRNSISGYKGVSWDKELKKWRALIRIDYKRIHLGYFSTPELAHEAYCKAAVKYFGEFSNFG